MMHTSSSQSQPQTPQRRPAGGPFGGPPGMLRGGEKAVNFKATMAKLLQYLRQYRVQLIVVILFAIASTIFSIVGPKILGKATTKLFEGIVAQFAGTGQGVDFAYIGNILMWLMGLYSGFSGFCLHPGLDHDRYLDEDHLPLPQGHRRKDQPHAAALL